MMQEAQIKNYLEIARIRADMSKCSRRQFCALVIKNGVLVSMGYNGSIRGSYNCGQEIKCLKDLYDEPHYLTYENCPAVHAELNAILNAARNGISLLGGTLILNSSTGSSTRPCHLCRRAIVQAGIEEVIYKPGEEVVREKTPKFIEMDREWIEEKQRGGQGLEDRV